MLVYYCENANNEPKHKSKYKLPNLQSISI